MPMTYDLPDAKVRDALEAVLDEGVSGFLPGDGFDNNDAPRLDEYLLHLGYTPHDVIRQGPGQLKTVITTCGLRVSRNGACDRVQRP